MRFFDHVRNKAEVIAKLRAAGLWPSEDGLAPPSGEGQVREGPVPETRPLTPEEREVDRLMRQAPEPPDG